MLEAAPPVLPPVAYLSVPTRHWVSIAALRGAAPDSAFGVDLPRTPRRVTAMGVSYLWSGPGAWFAMSDNPALFADIAARAGSSAAVTEQSDGLFTILLTGPHTKDILAKLVPIDLHDDAFPPDAVALTLAAHIGVRLWREPDGAFGLACPRSYAADLHHALRQAGAAFVD